MGPLLVSSGDDAQVSDDALVYGLQWGRCW